MKRKKNFLNLSNVTILQKIAIPLTIGYVLSFVTFFILFQKISKKEVENNLQTRLETINGELEISNNNIREKTLMMATVLAKNPEVILAYETYYKTYNLDSSTVILDRAIPDISWSLEQSFGEHIRIHFHLPPGTSFYRSWIPNKGDDISAYRSTLKEVYATEEPVSGIEIGKDGFEIRGIHPVFNKENILLGSVEVYFPIAEIMKSINQNESDLSTLLILKSSMELFMKGEINAGYTPVKELFISNDDEIRAIHTEMLSEDVLHKGLKESIYQSVNKYGFLIRPVKNFLGKPEGLIVYQMDLTDSLKKTKKLETTVGFVLFNIMLIVLILIVVITKKAVTTPIHNIIEILYGLSKGEHNRRLKVRSNDEIGKIKKAINKLNENLINIESFAHEIGEGKLDAKFEPRSRKDTLAFTLIHMKDRLMKARQETEKSREMEMAREWRSKGVNEIYETIRKYSKVGDELFYKIISQVVQYIGAKQGGVFIKEDGGDYLVLKGCYAYDRNKFINKKIHIKEGLIGRCFQEKEFLNINNLPEDYLKIKSGVGESKPNSLLLVPLFHDDKVKGIIELASFNNFSENDIEYIKEVSEQLAAALIDIEYALQTERLLGESKEKENKLVQQEEEMRQNMEELMATQEQMERKSDEFKSLVNALATNEIEIDEFMDKINNI